MLTEERGAVAVLTAFTLVIIMSVAAFVMDIGTLRVARADMQSLADVVALDLVRDLDGRSVAQLQPVMAADASASIARNTSTVGSPPTATVELGTTSAAGAFVVLSSGAPTAVRVHVGTNVSFAFARIIGQDSGSTTRAAIANTSSNACFRLGSFAASLRSGDSSIAGVFESMLGSSSALGISMTSVGYMGLINSSISLSALATQLGVGTPDALVQQSSISVKGLLTASAQVLTASGDTNGGAVMGQIAAKVSSTVVANMGQILSIGGGQAIGSSINAIDLLGGAALGAAYLANVADHSNLLHTGVVWSAPHASNGDIALTVIEPPKQGCGMPGAASASTGQVQLVTSIGFNLPNTVGALSASSISDVTSKQASLDVDAEIGGASGTLTGMTCTSSLTETRVAISSRLTKLSVQLPFQLNGTVATTGIVPTSLIPANMIGAQVQLHLAMKSSSLVQTAAQGSGTDTAYDVPPHDYTDPQPSPGSSSSYVGLVTPTVSVDLSKSSASLVGSVLGLPVTIALDVSKLDLSSIVAAATSSVIGSSVSELVANLNDALTPVAELLGIRFAGADLFGVSTPTCSTPRLIG
ncbi:MAG TPA: pilus assembly protein TadG-related protein [Nocardioides sp.]|nr:pilus assembly protein TadG-related protein [Nocardioides sp.]